MTPIKNLILDMDGVLWRGETPMPGLPDFFAALRAAGIGFVLATNNASKTLTQYTERLARFGVDMPEDRILTSAEATASHLTEHYPPGTAVYVVGDRGLYEAMSHHGFRPISPEAVRAGERAELVVVGFTAHARYEDLAMATYLIRHGAAYYGSNPDVTIPSELGPLPGAGAWLAFLTAATGVEPIVIGKPGPILFQQAVDRLQGDFASTAMVGDRLETDIHGAEAVGLQTVLVLSGISTREEAAAGSTKPDYIFDDITALAEYLTRETTSVSD